MQKPFNNASSYESFKPIQEDTHSDGTPKSTGNAFDIKNYINKKKQDEKNYRNHDAVKRSTGTVYLRKDNAVSDEPEVKKEPVLNADGTVKRGRGRPAGK